MKKRKLQLDREILTIGGQNSSVNGGSIWSIVQSISIVFSIASAVEPDFCDCLDTDSCPKGEPTGGLSDCENYSNCGNCTHNRLC